MVTQTVVRVEEGTCTAILPQQCDLMQLYISLSPQPTSAFARPGTHFTFFFEARNIPQPCRLTLSTPLLAGGTAFAVDPNHQARQVCTTIQQRDGGASGERRGDYLLLWLPAPQ